LVQKRDAHIEAAIAYAIRWINEQNSEHLEYYIEYVHPADYYDGVIKADKGVRQLWADNAIFGVAAILPTTDLITAEVNIFQHALCSKLGKLWPYSVRPHQSSTNMSKKLPLR
uniref:Amidohydrolase n=1 Tax=Gongylonema pulchrum TaxID=637853 RepID=A0A183DDV0_9BILA